MNFSIINLGCKVNRVESDSFGAFLLSNGACATSLEFANLVIVNTCTVTGDAEKKTRKAVRRAVREAKQAHIVVTGCAAAINPELYKALSPRICVVPKGLVSEYLEKQLFINHAMDNSGHHGSFIPFDSSTNERIGDSFPTRVAVKIQDGCNHACAYCIVHTARGKAWSRNWDAIIDEVVALESHGVKEIVLTGIDLGSYRFGKRRLSDLLEELLTKTSKVRFRISSIEPCSIDKKLPELLLSSRGRICRHLHLPLQSGSHKVLKEMNRPYSRDYYLELCENLHAEIPQLSLTTDIIVGFPGETESEFKETLDVATKVGFSKIHVFRYSKRDGTPAALRSDQISPEIINRRACELSALSENLRSAFAQSLLGTEELVVVEKKGWGMTESYYHIRVPENFEPGSTHLLRIRELDSLGVLIS